MSTSDPRRLSEGDNLTVFSVEDDCILVVDNDGNKYELMLEGPDSIAVIWTVDDVKSVRPDLTDEQCRQVLAAVDHNHDASLGITWETLANEAWDLVPDGLRKQVQAYAERLVAAGDTATLQEVFGDRAADLDLSQFANQELLDIYTNYIAEDEKDEDDDG